MNDNYCIYYHRNLINNKIYIGQTKNPTTRWFTSNYKGCIKLYRAIKKYGRENFETQILINNLTVEEANIIEEYLIKYYDTIKNGYNLKSGGLNNKYSEESKLKMKRSQKRKKKVICLETNIIYESTMEIQRKLGYNNTNISACCNGKLYTAYGFHWRYLNDKKEINNIDKRKRKVRCVETNKIYESVSMAAKELNLQRPNITHCCQGELKTTGGFHWEYA